jgi:hypothetical protein
VKKFWGFELRITPISFGLGKNYELRMGYLERELIVHLKRELPRWLGFLFATRVSGPACFKVTPSVLARVLAFFIASRVSEMGFVFGLAPSSPSAARSLRGLHFFELLIINYKLLINISCLLRGPSGKN